jgi:hypothetical protein
LLVAKFRVHLEHDKSVVVEADYYGVDHWLTFYRDREAGIFYAFGPSRWVWVEKKESDESSWGGGLDD